MATNSPVLIAATARLRRPPKCRCARNMIGHVAITMIEAHRIAGRNGRNTANVPHSNAATQARRMASLIRVDRCEFMSRFGGAKIGW